MHLDGRPAIREELSPMNAAMIHRGPDDEGYHLDGSAGISIRRLSILDIEGGHQPIASEDRRYWIVCNGEIYNYVELRSELKSKGHVFTTKTDVETIVHLYEDMGPRCLERLNGMFAFSIWDSREKELFVAVDRLGIKPLYYIRNGAFFSFSSELKSLMTLPFEKEIDRTSYLLYMLLLYVPHPLSMIKGVRRFEPATYMKIGRNGKTVQRSYWDIGDIPPDGAVDEKGLGEKIVGMLSDAVKIQLRSDVPVGTFLSGGIDSSTVVAMISRIGDRDALRTFAVGYEGHYIDERPYAGEVARLFDTRHSELFVTPDVVKRNLGRVIRHMDEPIGDSAAIPTFLLSELAREAGVKVILNGTGGDEVFGGYPRYLTGGPGQAMKDTARPIRDAAISFLHRPMRLSSALRSGKGSLGYLSHIGSMSAVQMDGLLREKASFEDLLDAFEGTMGDRFDSLVSMPRAERLMRFDLKTYLVDDLLFLLDKMTMAHSVEGRVPLLDHRIVELMASIPSRLKLEGGRLKGSMRKALSGVLPESVLDRPKAGFGGPVFFWLSNNILSEAGVFEDDMSQVTEEVFRADKIRTMVRESRQAAGHRQFVYNLAIFEMWYKDVFRGERIGQRS